MAALPEFDTHLAANSKQHLRARPTMADDDRYEDDEDWYDDEQESGGTDSVPCPECGGSIYEHSDKCSNCGYWLLDSDRRNSGSRGLRPNWVTLTAIMLLLLFLVSLMWW